MEYIIENDILHNNQPLNLEDIMENDILKTTDILLKDNLSLKSGLDKKCMNNINILIKKIMDILDKGFLEFIVHEKIMKLLILNTIITIYLFLEEYFENTITSIFFDLKIYPFRYTMLKSLSIHHLDNTDERKLIFQAIFLIILREKIPPKYKLIDDLLLNYPEFKSYSEYKINKLFNFSNWKDLLFYTIKPYGNKGFSIKLITIISEGKNIVYITGGGMTKDTSDRVLIFHREGNFESSSKKRKISEVE